MIHVLHIGTEKSWRGGENQILQLVQAGAADVRHYVAYPRNTRAIEVFSQATKVCELASSKSYDFRCPRQILEFCEANAIKVLNSHSSVALGWALKVKVKMPKLRLVSHRRVAFPLKQNIWSRRKHLSADIDAYVAISDYIGKQLLSFGVDPAKVHVVRSAVSEGDAKIDKSVARQQLLSELRLSEASVLFGHVGAMTNEKGQDLSVRAFARLLEKEPRGHLILAGDGVLMSKLQKLAADLKVSSHVHFLGHISNVKNLLAGLDVLLVPSRQEGLGTIVLDAILTDTLVVASDAGGLPEMIIHDETGLSFTSEDEKELAEAMEKSLSLYKSGDLQKLARKRVQEHFSLASMVEGNLRIYRSVAEKI